MELKIDKKRVLSAAEKYSSAKDVLKELFPDAFNKTDFRDIKTFEDACEVLELDPTELFSEIDTLDEIAYKKLKVIVKAINQGWSPEWNNSNQRKWHPWFNLSSGFGFSFSGYHYGRTSTYFGSRLCFESEEKSNYAANQFIQLYEDLLTIKK